MPETAMPSDRALELVELAGMLKLTPLQADFVLALVADPKCNQTRAALEPGASPKTAHIWASKTLRLAKVQEFLAKVTEAAAERARERAMASPAVRRMEQAVMETAEHQLRLSRLGRADIGRHLAINQDGRVEVQIDPDYADIIREVRIEERPDKSGVPVRRTSIRVADPVPALVALGRIRAWEKTEAEEGTQALTILGATSVQVFKAAYLRLIAQGNSDGIPTSDYAAQPATRHHRLGSSD